MADAPTRTALVTGGARRVGRHVALHLARRGWDVAITYNQSVGEMSTLAGEVEGMGRQFAPIQADFAADPDAAAAKIARAVSARFGRLDVLMHNASLYAPRPLAEVDAAEFARYFAVHVTVPALLTRGLRPLLEVAGGTVVTMTDSDIDADRARPQFLAYQASKAALANLTINLARELAPNVTVNAIAPGAVLWNESATPQEREQYLSRVPLARPGSPADVAELVEFLATRGRYVTGQTIRLDGGRAIR